MKSCFVAGCFILMLTVGCNRPPEGTKNGDCSDGKDNDYNGQVDCEDDGCAGFTSCAEKPRSKLLSSQVRAAAKKAARENSTDAFLEE